MTMVSDLAGYIESLRRLRSLPNLRVIGPGHGPLITEPVAYIDDYITHREERDRQIVMAMEAAGTALTSWQIMERLYVGLDPRLFRMADANVRAHLVKLEKEGRLRLHAGRRGPEFARALSGERAGRGVGEAASLRAPLTSRTAPGEDPSTGSGRGTTRLSLMLSLSKHATPRVRDGPRNTRRA